MKKMCNNVQEKIATEENLLEIDLSHIQNCPECSLVKNEFDLLKSIMIESADFEVPVGFADSVMNRIALDETAPTDEWMAFINRFSDKVMSVPIFQYLALISGALISLFSLIRFGLSVIIPL